MDICSIAKIKITFLKDHLVARFIVQSIANAIVG